MNAIFPQKLKLGDEIRIIAPSLNLSTIPFVTQQKAEKRLIKLGYRVSYGRNCQNKGLFKSDLIEEKLDDLHEAFKNPRVTMIVAAIGGYNCNQLLPYLDYELIKKNPKIILGFSDITALLNTIYAKTGIITYHGPGFSRFGDKKYTTTKKSFIQLFVEKKPLTLTFPNDSTLSSTKPFVIQSGSTEGISLGGNLCTFNLLQGTNFIPSLKNSIVFIEDDPLLEDFDMEFERNLQSLLHQPDADKIKGIIIGKFQRECRMNRKKIIEIIRTKKELRSKPIVANIPIGHPVPNYIFPIGAQMKLNANKNNIAITIAN